MLQACRESAAFAGMDMAVEPITQEIRIVILPEIACMTRLLGPSKRKPMRVIRERLNAALKETERRLESGDIEPWHVIRLSEADDHVPVTARTMRVGILSVEDGPLGWKHILAGLSAIASLKLDKAVYCVQGSEESLSDARQTLLGFDPLLGCLPGPASTAAPRLLALNPDQEIVISVIPLNSAESEYPPIFHQVRPRNISSSALEVFIEKAKI